MDWQSVSARPFSAACRRSRSLFRSAHKEPWQCRDCLSKAFVPLRLSAGLGSYDGAFVMVRGVGLELLQRWCWRGGLSALRRQRVHWCRYCVTAHLVQRQATNRDPKPNTEKDDIPSFHDWIRGDFDTERGRLGWAALRQRSLFFCRSQPQRSA